MRRIVYFFRLIFEVWRFQNAEKINKTLSTKGYPLLRITHHKSKKNSRVFKRFMGFSNISHFIITTLEELVWTTEYMNF